MSESLALNQFRDSLRLAQSLLELEVGYKDPPAPEDKHAVEGLRGGAAVLMVAAFENYLRTAVAETMEDLIREEPVVLLTALPVKTQVRAVYSTLETAMKGPPGETSLKSDRLTEVLRVCRLLAEGRYDPSAMGASQGNPNAEWVKDMFRNLGVADVFSSIRAGFDAEWGRLEALSFLSDKLDEIVIRRHVVAHTASALNLSRSDLREAPRFLWALGLSLSATLENQATKLRRTLE